VSSAKDPRIDAYIDGLPQWVNVFLYDGGIVPDPEHIITGGHHTKTARTVAIYENEAINESALVAMLPPECRNNRAGGGRKLKVRPS
jgi:hypothetical protein